MGIESKNYIIVGTGFISIIVLFIFFIFSNNSLFPTLDPGITEEQSTTMTIAKFLNPPSNSINIINVSETQLSQCKTLNIALQEVVNSNENFEQFNLNNSEFNCIDSFLDSLSINDDIPYIYYQGIYFEITFMVG